MERCSLVTDEPMTGKTACIGRRLQGVARTSFRGCKGCPGMLLQDVDGSGWSHECSLLKHH